MTDELLTPEEIEKVLYSVRFNDCELTEHRERMAVILAAKAQLAKRRTPDRGGVRDIIKRYYREYTVLGRGIKLHRQANEIAGQIIALMEKK